MIFMGLINEFPVKQQMNAHDCSVCVMWCVLKYYGIKIHYKKLYAFVAPPTQNDEGLSGEEIVEFLNKFKIKTVSEKSNISSLKAYTDNGHPVIVSIQHRKEYNKEWRYTRKYGHYVVVLQVTKTSVRYMDPNYGKIQTLNIKDFKERWHDADDENFYRNPAIVCLSNDI